VNQAKTPDLISPGETEPVHGHPREGNLRLFCGVPGHKAMGMDVHITVS